MSESIRRKPVLGCIADDVTGATDLAINLSQGGMKVVQVFGVVDPQMISRLDDVDAIVIALKSRSIEPDEAIASSRQCAGVLRECGVTRFYFKYCSTFDSTEKGNIGPVAEALMDELGVTQTIFCPAFPRAGRTVYQGHLFVGKRLLHESGMQHHPVNPMKDANLVRFLGKQASGQVGLLTYQDIQSGCQRVLEQAETLNREGVSLLVTDACDNDQLATLANAFADSTLLTGGSGLARYLAEAYRERSILQSEKFTADAAHVGGRGLIVAGSCSQATQRQVAWMRDRAACCQVDVSELITHPESEFARVRQWAHAADRSTDLLVASTSEPEVVQELQARHGASEVATAVETFLASITDGLVQDFDVRRLILAGGETSGAIVERLGIRALHIGPEICAGVPWTQTIGREPAITLALKSGNFGDDDFFASAMEMVR